jgi:hypothetical protein
MHASLTIARQLEPSFSCRYLPVVFEFVKEALDEIAFPLEPERETDRGFAICFWQGVSPRALQEDHFAQPDGVLGSVSEHYLAVTDAFQKFAESLNVLGLSRHSHITSISIGSRVHVPVPSTSLGPAPEPVLTGRARPIAFRQIAPLDLFDKSGCIIPHLNSVISYRLIRRLPWKQLN